MSRIRKAYADQFRVQLQRVGTRKIEKGIRWMMERAEVHMRQQTIPLVEALAKIQLHLAAKKPFQPAQHSASPDCFLCDAGLGGLARWLRAAGYRALWTPDISDDALLNQARTLSAVVLTTDSLLLERRVLRDRKILSLWLPPALGIPAQLRAVFSAYGLELREPRCMACGGELLVTDKESLRDRIPPRTYRWLDEYFVCRDCGQLFWRGTHWERISRELRTFCLA